MAKFKYLVGSDLSFIKINLTQDQKYWTFSESETINNALIAYSSSYKMAKFKYPVGSDLSFIKINLTQDEKYWTFSESETINNPLIAYSSSYKMAKFKYLVGSDLSRHHSLSVIVPHLKISLLF